MSNPLDHQRIQKAIEDFYKINSITTARIENDDNLKNMVEKVRRWLKPVKAEDQDYFLMLLKNFNYFDRVNVGDGFRSVFNQFRSAIGDLSETAYLVIGSKCGIFNGAHEILPIFRRVNDISKDMIASDPRAFYDENKNSIIKNIVFIDDIIGSGTTFEYYFKQLKKSCPELIKGKDIYVLSLVILPKGKKKINKMKFQSYSRQSMEKVFDNITIFGDKKTGSNVRKQIKFYEKKVLFPEKISVLGYKQSEGLVAFFHNTPNNTLASFWAPSSENYEWFPLFPREERGQGFKTFNNPKNDLKFLQRIKKTKKKLLDRILLEIGYAPIQDKESIT